MALLFPSLISADLLNLESEIRLLDPYCPGYHLDIMDYHFVPNLTWGPAFIGAIRSITQRQLWLHLMVDNPRVWIENLSLPEKTIVTVHKEAMGNDYALIEQIKERGWLPSIALNPETPVETLFDWSPGLYQILLMSVAPGRSGQDFIPETVVKVKALAKHRATHQGQTFTIALDGGISAHNIKELARLGVDHFAIASAIFNDTDPVEALQRLQELAT